MEDSWREAEWLLKEKYHGIKSKAYKRDLTLLESGYPLAYLIGHVPFLDTTIYLDSHPLVPRSETEYWVEHAIKDMQKRKKADLKVLDLCAGSGCIGIAVLRAIPKASVDFAELEREHRTTIAKNIRENGIDASRAQIISCDLFENVHESYDYILSNPPYIDKAAGTVDANVAAYEPVLALYGGKEGFEIIRRIIEDAPRHLNPGGSIYLEHEPKQARAIRILAERHSLSTCTERDQYGSLRYTILTRAGRQRVRQ